MSGAGPPSAETFDGTLVPARFLDRPNRFVLHARLVDGGAVRAHLPNPGRLDQILTPGRELRLRPASSPDRTTEWSAVLARTPEAEHWVSLVTTLPNRLVGEALRSGAIEELAGWEVERAEVTIGESRLDFLLRRRGRRLALEVKSVTLARRGVGLFPDAVTARGTRHVRELSERAGREGWEAALIFVAQRPDVTAVTAAPDIDPEFASALERARDAGVRALARRCAVSPRGVALGASLPVPPAADAPGPTPDPGDDGA